MKFNAMIGPGLFPHLPSPNSPISGAHVHGSGPNAAMKENSHSNSGEFTGDTFERVPDTAPAYQPTHHLQDYAFVT